MEVKGTKVQRNIINAAASINVHGKFINLWLVSQVAKMAIGYRFLC